MNGWMAVPLVAQRMRRFVVCGGALSLWLLVPIGPVSAEPGDVTLASTSDAGVKGNSDSRTTSFSADGTIAAFSSSATNLDPADTDSFNDAYVKDLVTGELTLASTSDTGVKGNSSSSDVALSGDGRLVAFSSNSTNLDRADTDTFDDVYVKDLVTGDLTLVSTSDTGVKGNRYSYGVALSADGRFVAFSSDASNLDPADNDGFDDLYVKDLVTGDITLASTSDTGVKAIGFSLDAVLSGDGSLVAFSSDATNLDPADTDGSRDVYVKDLLTGGLTLVSTSDTGAKGNGWTSYSALSGDGSLVAFSSDSDNLDPADTDTFYDVFVKDLVTGDLTLVSTSDTGVKGNSFSAGVALSANGRFLAFSSGSTNLDPADTDSVADVYVKDRATGDLTLVSTSDAGVDGNGYSDDAALSGDGITVAFSSASTNLDPADTDSFTDVYVEVAKTCNGEAVTILGTAHADVIVGTPGRDVIDGHSGADTINGVAGNDTVCGVAGGDLLTGGSGYDVLLGGNGGDVLFGMNGADTLEGGPGADILKGEAGKDLLKGGPGKDTLKGGDGADTCSGGAGIDTGQSCETKSGIP